jgi:hypothetical protein
MDEARAQTKGGEMNEAQVKQRERRTRKTGHGVKHECHVAADGCSCLHVVLLRRTHDGSSESTLDIYTLDDTHICIIDGERHTLDSVHASSTLTGKSKCLLCQKERKKLQGRTLS